MYQPPNWAEIRPKYPYSGYPAHRDGAIAYWDQASEAAVDAFLQAICTAIKEQLEKESPGSFFNIGYKSVLNFLNGEGFD